MLFITFSHKDILKISRLQNFDIKIFIFSSFRLYLQHGGHISLTLSGTTAYSLVKGIVFLLLLPALFVASKKKNVLCVMHGTFFCGIETFSLKRLQDSPEPLTFVHRKV